MNLVGMCTNDVGSTSPNLGSGIPCSDSSNKLNADGIHRAAETVVRQALCSFSRLVDEVIFVLK